MTYVEETLLVAYQTLLQFVHTLRRFHNTAESVAPPIPIYFQQFAIFFFNYPQMLHDQNLLYPQHEVESGCTVAFLHYLSYYLLSHNDNKLLNRQTNTCTLSIFFYLLKLI